MPAGAKLEVVQDAGTRVHNAVANVQEALIEGALLTVLVVFLFLNSWRSTVITGLALPVSVLASFIAVWAFGFTLNTMSLMGLSLAIGILIDDAIVVRENIVRHIEMGKDHYEASREGTDEIGLAVTATTFSIVAVFVPVAFMYGISGQWFKPFALTIACSVMVSLFVSFSLDPMLSAYWADPQTEAHERRNPIARALDRFNRWFDRMADRYKGVIAWALDHRLMMVGLALGTFIAALTIPARGVLAALVVLASLWGAFWILQKPLLRRLGVIRGASVKVAGVLAVLALMAVLVPLVPVVGQVGAGFVPVSDRSEISMIVEAPPGSNLEYTRLKAEEAARRARTHPEVDYTYTTVGTPVPLRTPSVDQALVYVKLVPKAERALHQEELGQILRDEMKQVGGAQVSVFTSGFGGAFKQIQIQMKGDDARVLTSLAQRAAEQIVARVPGAVDVGLSTRGQKPELEIQLNRGLAGSLGITVGQVAQSLRPAFAGLDAGDWVDPSGETRDVTVRLAPEARERITDLAQLPLVAGTGSGGVPSTLPLGQVATIRQGLGPAQIDHLDRDKVVIIQANVAGRPLTQVTNEIRAGLQRLNLPPGYEITYGGESQDQAEVFTDIFTALGVAVLLMYLILVVQFGSFLDPLAILVSLPLSLIGVVLALLVTRDTLNIMSLIGVILLMGIVAKNAILLIDFAKWARERGLELREALIDAGRIRLRPIIMTTFALIAGMIPVAIGHGEGADFRAPLGRAVIGGTLTSTLLTLLVIPTVYEILDDFRSWAMAKFRRRVTGGAAEPAPTPASRH
jgi:HAE1 family hydrophobic/amphiphilic exporter-1